MTLDMHGHVQVIALDSTMKPIGMFTKRDFHIEAQVRRMEAGKWAMTTPLEEWERLDQPVSVAFMWKGEVLFSGPVTSIEEVEDEYRLGPILTIQGVTDNVHMHDAMYFPDNTARKVQVDARADYVIRDIAYRTLMDELKTRLPYFEDRIGRRGMPPHADISSTGAVLTPPAWRGVLYEGSAASQANFVASESDMTWEIKWHPEFNRRRLVVYPTIPVVQHALLRGTGDIVSRKLTVKAPGVNTIRRFLVNGSGDRRDKFLIGSELLLSPAVIAWRTANGFAEQTPTSGSIPYSMSMLGIGYGRGAQVKHVKSKTLYNPVVVPGQPFLTERPYARAPEFVKDHGNLVSNTIEIADPADDNMLNLGDLPYSTSFAIPRKLDIRLGDWVRLGPRRQEVQRLVGWNIAVNDQGVRFQAVFGDDKESLENRSTPTEGGDTEIAAPPLPISAPADTRYTTSPSAVQNQRLRDMWWRQGGQSIQTSHANAATPDAPENVAPMIIHTVGRATWSEVTATDLRTIEDFGQTFTLYNPVVTEVDKYVNGKKLGPYMSWRFVNNTHGPQLYDRFHIGYDNHGASADGKVPTNPNSSGFSGSLDDGSISTNRIPGVQSAPVRYWGKPGDTLLSAFGAVNNTSRTERETVPFIAKDQAQANKHCVELDTPLRLIYDRQKVVLDHTSYTMEQWYPEAGASAGDYLYFRLGMFDPPDFDKGAQAGEQMHETEAYMRGSVTHKPADVAPAHFELHGPLLMHSSGTATPSIVENVMCLTSDWLTNGAAATGEGVKWEGFKGLDANGNVLAGSTYGHMVCWATRPLFRPGPLETGFERGRPIRMFLMVKKLPNMTRLATLFQDSNTLPSNLTRTPGWNGVLWKWNVSSP